jgi:hypothetical protein
VPRFAKIPKAKHISIAEHAKNADFPISLGVLSD